MSSLTDAYRAVDKAEFSAACAHIASIAQADQAAKDGDTERALRILDDGERKLVGFLTELRMVRQRIEATAQEEANERV